MRKCTKTKVPALPAQAKRSAVADSAESALKRRLAFGRRWLWQFRLVTLLRLGLLRRLGPGLQGLERETNPLLLRIDREHLHFHLLPFADDVARPEHAAVGQFANVDQPLDARL